MLQFDHHEICYMISLPSVISKINVCQLHLKKKIFKRCKTMMTRSPAFFNQRKKKITACRCVEVFAGENETEQSQFTRRK